LDLNSSWLGFSKYHLVGFFELAVWIFFYNMESREITKAGMFCHNVIEYRLPPFRRLNGAMGIFAVGKNSPRRVVGNVHIDKLVSERKYFIDYPRQVLTGTMLKHISRDDAVKFTLWKRVKWCKARVITGYGFTPPKRT